MTAVLTANNLAITIQQFSQNTQRKTSRHSIEGLPIPGSCTHSTSGGGSSIPGDFHRNRYGKAGSAWPQWSTSRMLPLMTTQGL